MRKTRINELIRQAMPPYLDSIRDFYRGCRMVAKAYGIEIRGDRIGVKQKHRIALAVLKNGVPTWPDAPPSRPRTAKESPQSKIDDFYTSWEWRRLRYDFLKDRDRRCECCGAQPSDGVKIVIDHIKPIRHHWHLRLNFGNLQILCEDCNMGKGSRDETDWRPANVIRLVKPGI